MKVIHLIYLAYKHDWRWNVVKRQWKDCFDFNTVSLLYGLITNLFIDIIMIGYFIYKVTLCPAVTVIRNDPECREFLAQWNRERQRRKKK